MPLVKNDVYAALTLPSAVGGPITGQFHWLIYVVEDELSGYKIHATDNTEDKTWKFEATPWAGMTSSSAVAFLKIGHIDTDFDWTLLVEYVKNIAMDIPPSQCAKESKFTCRVWFKEAIRVLNESGVFVKCPDVDALEKELSLNALRAAHSRQILVASARGADAWS